ncbi:hypothetical protein KIN20_034025 [Parelaphostrongylus tenuis]|uniref:Uncharacterized protein n=1 Tax=Parelaphostrongylus tenuis TaxID=148309 RepID=A0AAD5WJD1_PARTN|nr:hypothetical protein KIN20_034025 [Parelaphostrongylus tenuis]
MQNGLVILRMRRPFTAITPAPTLRSVKNTKDPLCNILTMKGKSEIQVNLKAN